jgi:uncharacterized membrane protein
MSIRFLNDINFYSISILFLLVIYLFDNKEKFIKIINISSIILYDQIKITIYFYFVEPNYNKCYKTHHFLYDQKCV